MAESIRFDFLSSGAEKLARDFRSTGDTAAAAARGAKVLQEVIEKLGQKENRTAAESALLAKALRQTGDAEDRAASKAVLADAAIRRLDDAMAENKRDALEAAAANRVLADSFGKIADKAGGPSLRGALAALSPALIPVSAGIAAGVGAIGVSFGAAAIGAGLFGALAKSVFANVSKDNQKLQTAQKQLAAAQIARSQATTRAQRDAADKQVKSAQDTIAAIRSEGAAYNQVLDLSKEIGTKWKVTSAQIASPALVPWLSAVSKGIAFIRPLVQPVADVFRYWGESVNAYFGSRQGSAEISRLAAAFGRFSAGQLKATGIFVTDIGRGVASLGRDLAGHNVDFGAFGKNLDQWGAAFLRWSRSGAARQDVSKFLAYIHANGPVVGDLLKNIGGVLAAFAPGLTSVGSLELRLVTDFVGFLARTPKAIAKPLVEVAGALLLLQKTGVLKVGIQITGAAVKWLTGGVIDVGGGAAAGAEIRAAFASGGATAAAEIRAALAGGGAAAGAEGAAGGAAAKGGIGGLLSGLAAQARGPALAAAAAAIAGGMVLKVREDLKSGFTGIVQDIPKWFNFGTLGFIAQSASGWADLIVSKIRHPLLSWEDGVRHFISGSFDQTRHDVSGIWGNLTGFLSGSWNKTWATITGRSAQGSKSVGDSLAAAGRSADNLRSRNLVPLQGEFGKVTGGIQGLAGTIQGTMLNALRAAGAKSDAIRTQNLVPLRGEVGKVSGGIQGLQGAINNLHGKTVNVGVHGSGSGGVQITPSSGVPGAKNYSVFFKPAAFGGMVNGGLPGRDSVPIMAMPGEVVVPTRLVRAGAVDHLRGKLPGFASGGLISGGSLAGAQDAVARFGGADAAALAQVDVNALIKAIKASIAARAAQLNPFAGITGVPSTGPIGAGAAAAQAYAKSILWAYGWGQNQFPPLQALWNGESGWRWNALNPASGAYGIPQSLPASKMAAAGADWRTNPATQIRWGLGYIKASYGSPANTYAKWLARFPHWYSEGGLVPGFASGGTVGRQGAAWLKAWQTRHGGGFGAAWGPTVLNQQIPEMAAAAARAKTLAGAPGLSAGQRKFWAGAAADETKRLGVLRKELATERAWRTQLGVNELGLDKQIRAAGNLPSLAGNVRGWKAQLGRDKATVAAISKMLGYSDAYIKAHPGAKPGPVLPGVTHTYGGDVANNLGAVLAAALGPFTGAARGGMVFDRGGTLRPGFNPVWNKTGRPEQLVPARGGSGRLQIEWVGGNGGDDLERWIKKNVRIRGGGDVQKAYGAH